MNLYKEKWSAQDLACIMQGCVLVDTIANLLGYDFSEVVFIHALMVKAKKKVDVKIKLF